MAISLVVADDHELVRAGVVSLLKGSGIRIVGQATSGDEAVEICQKLKPDVVLMDIRMPTSDGLAALERIRMEMPRQRVVMFSTYDNPTYIARSVALGAAGYVLKGSNREDLVAAISRAAKAEPPRVGLTPQTPVAMRRRRDRSEHNDTPLTGRELEVVRQIALGLPNREIGGALGISTETVKEHVQNILRKLNATDRTQAAVWAVKRGIA